MKKASLMAMAILSSILVLTPLSVNASEAAENVTTESQMANELDDVDIQNIEGDVGNVDIDILDKEFDNEVKENTSSSNRVDVKYKDENTSAIDQTALTQGWVTFVVTIKNTTFTGDVSLTFLLTNNETGEITKKTLNSIDNFSGGIIKLPYGEYSVSLDDEYYEQFVIYENTLTINSAEQGYEVSINSLVEKQKDSEESEREEVSVALYLLKNNLFFLIILIACGGFLLYREIKKRREY